MNKLILITFLSLLLNACSFSDYVPEVPTLSLIKPYKADINQGTVLSRLSINQLKIGMSKKQVQELIGTPSVIDPFHNNQWDYINHSMMGSGEVIRYRLILKFEGVKLVNINTDGISSLPELTDKQKKLQETRIAEEKAKHAEQEKIKAKALEEKAKKLEEENKAKELEEKAKRKISPELTTNDKSSNKRL
jgi:outer membrane protein assembly factor BamE